MKARCVSFAERAVDAQTDAHIDTKRRHSLYRGVDILGRAREWLLRDDRPAVSQVSSNVAGCGTHGEAGLLLLVDAARPSSGSEQGTYPARCWSQRMAIAYKIHGRAARVQRLSTSTSNARGHMLMRHTKQLLSLTAVVLLAACTDNSLTNPFQNAVGTYDLTVYAGRQVPATYNIQPGDPTYPNGATFLVTDGSLVLNSNGTFVETNNYVVTPTGQSGTQQSFISSGTWTGGGTSITITAPPQNNNASRNFTGTLTFDSARNIYVFDYQEDNGSGGFDSFEYQSQR
jgi:hypothetical protein